MTMSPFIKLRRGFDSNTKGRNREPVRPAVVSVLLILVVSAIGCALGETSIPDSDERRASATRIAAEFGFERQGVIADEADELPIAAWVRRLPNNGESKPAVHIYIEGDGVAWQSRRRLSLDPTPVTPIALALAAEDASRATVVYLGRPCQYGFPAKNSCRPFLWTAARYGEVVIEAMNRRIDALRTELEHDAPITLIGYSGGGVVAALLAARRSDVHLLVTIAAPLDVDAWTRNANVSPLLASLSPANATGRLRGIRQHHFVGRDDTAVPISVTENFHHALGPDAPSTLTVVDDMDHRSWPRVWANLIQSTGLFEEMSSPGGP